MEVQSAGKGGGGARKLDRDDRGEPEEDDRAEQELDLLVRVRPGVLVDLIHDLSFDPDRDRHHDHGENLEQDAGQHRPDPPLKIARVAENSTRPIRSGPTATNKPRITWERNRITNPAEQAAIADAQNTTTTMLSPKSNVPSVRQT